MILHFLDDPGINPNDDAFEFHEDGLLIAEGGYITNLSSAKEPLPGLADDLAVTDYSGATYSMLGTLPDKLFALMMLGGDRVVSKTYAVRQLVHNQHG